jgi:hypothetical protein
LYGIKIMSRKIEGYAVYPTSPTFTIFEPPAAGTYTTPIGCKYIIVEMIGGGGGGGWQAANIMGGGGGSATYMELQFPAGSYTYSVGAGGLAGTTVNGGNGTAGGNTTFGAAVSGGGGFGANDGNGGDAGTFTTAGKVLFLVQGIYGSTPFDTIYTTNGGASFRCPATPLTSDLNYTTIPGGYGGGGDGSVNSTGDAGAGYPGRIIIKEFYV